MTHEEMIALAVEEGFSAAAVVRTEEIPFDSSFRPYCEENLCGQYGVNHSCPPDCGTPEEMRQRIVSHRYALVLQTLWQVDDYGDAVAAKRGKLTHNAMSLRLMERLREAGCEGFTVGAGGCTLCKPCKLAAGEPCAFPRLQYSCMSAYCIFVRKLCEACGIEYDSGDGLLSFYGLYVFESKTGGSSL